MIDQSSRYSATGTTVFIHADGSAVPCLKRRFLPQLPDSGSATKVQVGPADRLDLIAARLIGDPLQFWQIADANAALDPFELAHPGKQLVIPPLRFQQKGQP